MRKIGKYVALALGAAIILTGCTKNEQSVVEDAPSQVSSVEASTSASAEASTEEKVVSEVEEDNMMSIGETTVSNDIFSFILPFNDSKFIAQTSDNGISIYHKDSYDSGFGGFCYTISVYKQPSDYAGGMDVKVGEFMKDGETVYDVVVSYPSEVQWNYTKSEEMPEDYALVYNSINDAIPSLMGNNGETFENGKGCKGIDLYNDTLKTFADTISNDFNESTLEDNNLSNQYLSVKDLSKEERMKRIKYAYKDINGDGIEELLVGEAIDDKFVIYDLYTVVDRNVEHVLKSSNESKFYALEYFLVNETSDGEGVNYINVFDVEPNTTNFMPQVSFKHDTNTDTYGISYGSDDEYEEVTKEEYEERLNNFKNYSSLDLYSLSVME